MNKTNYISNNSVYRAHQNSTNKGKQACLGDFPVMKKDKFYQAFHWASLFTQVVCYSVRKSLSAVDYLWSCNMFLCIPVLDFLSLFKGVAFLAQSFDFLILFITLLKIVLLKVCIRQKQHRYQHLYAKSVP